MTIKEFKKILTIDYRIEITICSFSDESKDTTFKNISEFIRNKSLDNEIISTNSGALEIYQNYILIWIH